MYFISHFYISKEIKIENTEFKTMKKRRGNYDITKLMLWAEHIKLHQALKYNLYGSVIYLNNGQL